MRLVIPRLAHPHIHLTKAFLPAVFFFSGVAYDTLTLTRIDQLFDNLTILGYLLLLGLLIVFTGRESLAGSVPSEPGSPPPVPRFWDRARPYTPAVMQFLLGGLFSAYAIFYSQSASFTSTLVFFCLLVGLLIANEFYKDRLSNFRFLVVLYALVCFSFLTFFLPMLTGMMNTVMFLIGAFLSLAATRMVIKLACGNKPDQFKQETIKAGLPAAALVGLMVVFYFLNWIPPVPLSMKFGGIYHQITKQDDVYQLAFEKGIWYQFWKRSDDPFRGTGPAHCFTAIFVPVTLQTTILHHWQYRPEGRAKFSTTDRIPMTISGGRDAGYRGYTVKAHVEPGEWRVTVETKEGRSLGRVTFDALPAPADPAEVVELDTTRY